MNIYNLKKSVCFIILLLPISFCESPLYTQVSQKKILQNLEGNSNKPKLLVQAGYSGDVRNVNFSQDGRFILVSAEKTLLYETESGREICTFEGTPGAISPDFRFVLTGREGIAHLWDISTNEEIQKFIGHKSEITCLSFFHDGKSIVTGSYDKTVRIWDVNSGKELKCLTGHSENIESLAISHDGKFVLTGGGPNDDTARLWVADTGKEIHCFSAHKNAVESVTFSPNGRLILTGSYDGSVILWDADSFKEIKRFCGETVSFSSDGCFALIGNREKAYIVDLETGKELKRFLHPFSSKTNLSWKENDVINIAISSVAFSPINNFVVTANRVTSAKGYGYRTVCIWDIDSGKEIRRFEETSFPVFSVKCSLDGKLIIIGCENSYAYQWDLTKGRQERRLNCFDNSSFNYVQGINSLAISPNNYFVLTGSMNGMAFLWNLSNGQMIKKFPHCGYTNNLIFSSDNRYFVTGGDCRNIIIWDMKTFLPKQTFFSKNNEFYYRSAKLYYIDQSPDSQYILTVRMDDQICQWDTSSQKEVCRYEHNNAFFAKFSPDSRYIISGGGDSTARLWNSSTGKEIYRIKHNNVVSCADFSSDNQLVVTGCWDNNAYLWNLKSGKKLKAFKGHLNWIRSVSFSNDNQFIFTGSMDATTRCWDVETGKELFRLLSFIDGNWVVAAPEGYFDTDNFEDIKNIHWIIPDEPMRPLPMEIFMRDYYEPKLLTRLLAGEDLPPIKSLSQLNRVQPEVKILDIKYNTIKPGTVAVVVEVGRAEGEFGQGSHKKIMRTGVYDLRLFRDKQLVGYMPETDGEIHVDPTTGKRTIVFDNIKIPRQKNVEQVEFSAYAFNVDRVKSKTHRKTFKIPDSLAPVKGNAYIITVGVNAYENSDWDLKYAANDAEIIRNTLVDKLQKNREYKEVISIPLISDYKMKQGNRVITENNATKRNFKAVLDLLAGKKVAPSIIKSIPNAGRIREANPEDLIIISFSSHGDTDRQGNFYFFPHDIGKNPDRDTRLKDFLNRCISSDELSLWLRDVDADDMVMIVDTCYSAAAVEQEGFKAGPMGSRGLGQLAYNKGMYILTASQADDLALESEQVKHGLLTYALIYDGIEEKKADFKPKDRKITISEWLEYGEDRVPILYEEINKGNLPSFKKGNNTRSTAIWVADKNKNSLKKKYAFQKPRLFNFKKRKSDVTLLLLIRRLRNKHRWFQPINLKV